MIIKGGDKIFIWGMPASGKSTIGKLLASIKGIAHYDLDEWIVSGTGISIERWFAEFGEEAFRKVESQYLKGLLDFKGNFVVSCGGGTPCFEENARRMEESGVTIFLDVPNEALVTRLTSLDERGKRPLLAKKPALLVSEIIDEMSSHRRRYYNTAQIRIVASGLASPRQTAAMIAGILG
jgi:shikimate kinase